MRLKYFELGNSKSFGVSFAVQESLIAGVKHETCLASFNLSALKDSRGKEEQGVKTMAES